MDNRCTRTRHVLRKIYDPIRSRYPTVPSEKVFEKTFGSESNMCILRVIDDIIYANTFIIDTT